MRDGSRECWSLVLALVLVLPLAVLESTVSVLGLALERKEPGRGGVGGGRTGTRRMEGWGLVQQQQQRSSACGRVAVLLLGGRGGEGKYQVPCCFSTCYGRGGAPGEDEDEEGEGEGEDKKDEDWCTLRITAQRSDSTSNMFPPRPPRIFRQRTGQDAFSSLVCVNGISLQHLSVSPGRCAHLTVHDMNVVTHIKICPPKLSDSDSEDPNGPSNPSSIRYAVSVCLSTT
ncbi:hypothetical protein CCHR01_16059 [Colletotrichum chrysophilum]|uniref:Uncharacterized protein n=1 Tax=Colletotrichum chrysophilum TaxID=1836956 RepID=A0AAD9EAT9_9PEZI|nr:hypothetical protein CCHR01_16059 [Colletotrichum chrysophilum]